MTQKTKKIKAWAIIEKDDLYVFWAGKAFVYEVFFVNSSAQQYADRYNEKQKKYKFKVIPINITYSLPQGGKKR